MRGGFPLTLMVPSIPRDTRQQQVVLSVILEGGSLPLMRLTWARARLCEQSCGILLKV
ncbi:hypothetical protein LINPERHAP2_LOCUS12080 [Linum perenne]